MVFVVESLRQAPDPERERHCVEVPALPAARWSRSVPVQALLVPLAAAPRALRRGRNWRGSHAHGAK